MRIGGRLLVAALATVVVVAVLLCAGGTALAAHSDDLGCNKCHVPHKALKADGTTYGAPLWNPAAVSTVTTWTIYTSPTFDALTTGITQPDGPTKLCLGCHDGGSYGTSAGITTAHSFGPGGGMTLTESHPVSFVYDTGLANNPNLHVPGELKDPATALSGMTTAGTIATDMLDKNSKLQCTSCHDVHTSGKGTYQLKIDYTDGKTLCQTCHNK